MKTMTPLLVSLGSGLLLMCGCATQPVVLDTVGPAQAGHFVPDSRGYLRIYSATAAQELGKNTFYYLHTGYRVYDAAGKFIQFVPNHVGDMDESPTTLLLPVGQYRIKAQSDIYGWVTVPVAIESHRYTDVHLVSTWRMPAEVASKKFVLLPDGRPVGWSYMSEKDDN